MMTKEWLDSTFPDLTEAEELVVDRLWETSYDDDSKISDNIPRPTVQMHVSEMRGRGMPIEDIEHFAPAWMEGFILGLHLGRSE